MKIQPIALFLSLLMFVSSCTVNSHIMLKTPKDYVFDEIPEDQNKEYALIDGDQLTFRLFSNGGFSLIDITSGKKGNVSKNLGGGITYLIQPDGMVKLPILGEVNLVGKTVREAELELEKMYAEYYVDPYLQLKVSNKRVIVFPGTGSNARVLTLQYNSTTLLETLALVGGISKDSKANTVKVIRKIEGKKEREVYLIDLSTIDGLKQGDMIVQADDIIYVQPNANIARELLQDITPIVSLITSAVLFYVTIKSLPNR